MRGKHPDDKLDLWQYVPFNPDGADALVHGLMLMLDIEEELPGFKTAVGRAEASERVIKIPEKCDTAKKLLVAFHEIGHVVYASKRYKYPYEYEYDAEQYALNLARALQCIKKRSIESYERDARHYVLRYINSDKKLPIKEVKKEIVDWINDPELNEKYYGRKLEEI